MIFKILPTVTIVKLLMDYSSLCLRLSAVNTSITLFYKANVESIAQNEMLILYSMF